MPKRFKYILFLYIFFSLLTPGKGLSQYLIYSDQPIDIEVEFLRESIEAAAQQSFFNVLKIVNKVNRSETFTLNITAPDGWNVVGDEKFDITIPPLDSLLIPIRVSVGSRVQGDIGYSIIASLTDIRGNTVKNVYSFVKIPRETDFSVKLIDRVAYFDQRTNLSQFSVNFQNKGNKEELVNIALSAEEAIGIEKSNQNQFTTDITINPYADTTITFNVALKDLITNGKTMYRLNMLVSTIDTTHRGTVWFRVLYNSYSNYISETLKPLVIEFNAQGLMQGDKIPSYVLNATGLILFKDRKDLYYQYRNFSSSSLEHLYKFNRMYIGSHIKNWQFEFGDSYKTLESPLSGRGGFIVYGTKKLKTELIANRNIRNDVNNIATSFQYNLTQSFNLKSGFAWNIDEKKDIDSKLGLLSSNFAIGKNHKFYMLFAYNQRQQQIGNKNSHDAFGGEFQYSTQLGDFSARVRAKYGSKLYYGNYQGRFDVAFQSDYKLNTYQRFNLSGYESRYDLPKIEDGELINQRNSINREVRLAYFYQLSPQALLSAGPGYEEFLTANVGIDPATNRIGTRGVNMTLSARFKVIDSYTTLTPQIIYSFVNVYDYPELALTTYPTVISREQFNYQYFSLNFRRRTWGFLASYNSGPKAIFEQFSYFFFSRQNRRLRVMPYIDMFIYKNQLQLITNVSYSNDLIARSTYTNITGQLYWHLPRNWRLGLLSAYSLQNRIDAQEVSQTYQTLYVEAGIKKEFNFSHPRIRYNNLTLVFFKDYNGNGIQDTNEPGIKNILVTLNKTFDKEVGDIPGDLTSVELLSDELGFVKLSDIPSGIYYLIYNPVGKDAGTFSKGLEDLNINLEKTTTLYVPFVEKNKVFGKIILNRSRLSGIGRLDVSNVRITATDSQGRSYSTLTDNNGEFVLFAPITDEYILTINNIYYENFDLRQNNFLVQFNGYKQFEVNFVFDEKVRRINFAATPEDLRTGIQQVRRTNISGTVKDANSQQPIRARINLINTRTNTIINSTNSSATSGDYTLTFMAGDNYLLEILADDYWYLSENIVLQQVTTFMNITRDVLLNPIAVGSRVELNIRFDVNSAYLAPESVAELNRLLRQVKNNPTVRLEIQGHCDDLEAIQKPDVGQERATAVAKYLIENGFSNVEVKDMRNNSPVSSNDTDEGRLRNRRIEVVVLRR